MLAIICIFMLATFGGESPRKIEAQFPLTASAFLSFLWNC